MLYLVYGPRESSELLMREAHAKLEKRFGCGSGGIVYSCIESGKNRDHYHLNCIIDKDTRTDSFRRSIRQLMNFPEELYQSAEDRHTFSVKNVTDLPGW